MADILIVGGGIAGAGAAYELAAFASVIVLEREPHCGYHSTGRSAASFTENYGGTLIRRLAIASRAFLESPPAAFSDHPLLSSRGMFTIARADQLDLLQSQLAVAQALVPSIREIEVAAAIARVPILRPDYVAGVFEEPHLQGWSDCSPACTIEGFAKGARARGARLVVQRGGRRRSSATGVSGASRRQPAPLQRRSSSTRPEPGPMSSRTWRASAPSAWCRSGGRHS